MARDYKKEAETAKKKKKYRAELRRERVKRGLTSKDGYANGNGDTHISHKGGKVVGTRKKKANLKDQPKRGKG